MNRTTIQCLLIIVNLLHGAVAMAAPAVTITIEGVDNELLTNVQQLLSVEQQREHPLLAEGRIQRLHSKADEEINNALQPFGYYRATIKKNLVLKSDEQWYATYNIALGEPLTITTLTRTIGGDAATDAPLKELWDSFPLKEGDVLNQSLYEQAKRDMLKLANERGYFDADFTIAQIAIDLKQYTSHITLQFSSGARYHFGQTELNQSVLNEDFLYRFVPFEQGDPYSINKLLDLQQGLMGSDYFSVVELQPQLPNRRDNTVPVLVNLEPRKQHRYLIALGYGTDTGPRGKLGWEMPRINRAGHRIDTEYRASAIGNNLSGRYRIPIRNPRKEQLIFSGSLANTRLDSSESSIANLGASLLQVHGPWQETFSLNYHNESYKIANIDRRTTLLMPGFSISRRLSGDHALIDQGLRLSAEIRGGAKGAFSDINFFQGQLHAKGITSLSERQRLIMRGTIGGINAIEFDKLPASLRFYAGGTQSVRGFRYQSLSPLNSDGKEIGGKYLLTSSAEYELRLNQEWSWALFVDAGNAFNDFNPNIKKGVGTGIRWQTPVGPLRFDIASAISEPGRPWKFHINVGPDL